MAKTWSTAGLTALEVVVALGIVGLLAAVATPSLIGQMARNRLQGAARQVMGDCLWARMQAVTEQNEFRIIFVSDYEYDLLDDDDNDGTVDPGEWVQRRDIRVSYHDVRIHATANPIFFPRGSASAGTVTVENPSGARKVAVHLTGRVKIG